MSEKSLYAALTVDGVSNSHLPAFKFAIDENRKSRSRPRTLRRQQKLDVEKDQSTLQPPIRKSTMHAAQESTDEMEEASNVNIPNRKSDGFDFKFPIFSLVNEKDFSHLRYMPKPKPNQPQNRQPSLPIPNSALPSRQPPISQYAHPNPQIHQPNPNSFPMPQTQHYPPQYPNRNFPPPAIDNKGPPNVGPTSMQYSLRANNVAYMQSQQMSGYMQPQMPRQNTQSMAPQSKQNTQQNQPFRSLYLNHEVMTQRYGLIKGQNEAPNIPLVLDRSDKIIKFTEQSNQSNSQSQQSTYQPMLYWNTIQFESPKFYTKLQENYTPRPNLDIQHSDVALNLILIEPNPPNIETQHHPKLNTEKIIGRTLRIVCEAKDNQNLNEEEDSAVSPYLRDLKSLSGKSGRIILIEQTSENPAFILNVGMSSRLITYYHQTTEEDLATTFIDTNLQYIKPNQNSPFLAQIAKSKPVVAFSCNLFDTPLAKHNIQLTDFLLVRDTVDNTKFYIRQIESAYCAGLLEARSKVFRPNKKITLTFTSNFITAILVNIFRGTEQFPKRRRIQVSSVLKEFFPDMNELKLRDVLKKFAKPYRESGNGFWEPNKNDLDTYFASIHINPEDVCSYQSMLAGYKKLRRNGVKLLIRSKRVFQQIKNLKGELTKKVAEKIELELMKTPWARTENFTKAFDGSLMEVTRADGEQIVRAKGRRGKQDGEQSNTKKTPRYGTDSDLRVLHIPQLNAKLAAYHIPEERINQLTRWDKVKLLRQLASNQRQQGVQTEDTEKYARGPRNEYQAKRDEYKKIYQQTFDNNLAFISSDNDKEAVTEEGALDDVAKLMARYESNSEGEEEELDAEDIDSLNDNQYAATKTDTGDPKALVPHGIATSHFDVDWKELGYGDCRMRKVAKLIDISYEKKNLEVKIYWERQPHQIQKLEKLEHDVNSQEIVRTMLGDDFVSSILSQQKKGLQDKLRRTRQQVKKNNDNLVQRFILSEHQVMLVKDPNKELTFCLTPEIISRIELASYNFRRKMYD